MKRFAIFAAVLVVTTALGGLMAFAGQAQAAESASSYCSSKYNSSKSDAYKECVSWYNQGKDAGADGLSHVMANCRSTYTDATKLRICQQSANQGAAGSRPSAPAAAPATGDPADATCPAAGCLPSRSSLGIPEVSAGGAVNSAVNIIGILAGILSVVFIIIGGIRYTTSQGNSANLDKAKSTILYAVIGLVLSVLAPLVVGFVISRTP